MKKIQLLLSAMFIICSLNAQVIINEISYNPCGTQGNDGDCEYIEIYNSGAAAVDLSDWTMDDPMFVFPAGTMIAAGEYILVTDDGNFASCAWANAVPAGVQTFAWTGGNLGNSGESLTLSDAGATAQDMFTYDDGPCGADGDCNSLQYSGTGDNMDCTTWVAQTPTPGASNDVAPTDCPDGSNIGDACDDGVATTVNDTVQDDCTCLGTDVGLTDCGAPTWEAVQVVNNSQTDVWTAIAGGWSMNGFVGGGSVEQVDQWLVYGPIDVSGTSSLFLNFDGAESFGVTDLNVVWTASYPGCPADATWTNAGIVTDAGAVSVDLSAAAGTDVFIAIEYSDDGADGYSGWDLTNFALLADVCPTPGAPMVSMCTMTFDCPTEMVNFGDACDDMDAATTNDVIQADCTCAGTVPMAAEIYISELSFNPCAEQGADGDCEYIIITNGGAADADISGYSIANGITFTFPAGTIIPAGGTLSIGASANCAGLDAFDLTALSGSLSNSTDETVEILDAGGVLVSAVTYNGTFGDGNCDANCFDAVGTASECPSSLYDPGAITGCTDMNACNYNPDATADDGSCFNIGDTCDDMDATTENDVYTDCMTCAGTPIGCPGGVIPGDPCDDMDATTENDVIQADCSCAGVVPTACPASAKINEFHYDNAGTDVNEFIEIALPTGSDPSGVVVTLYNGNGGGEYGSYTLTAGDFVSTDGTNDYYVWNVSMQNGNDGIAVSCDATVYEFITYEGAFDATDGPAAGMTGVDVGVEEATDAAETSSIMCDGAGAYLTNCVQDPGAANDTSTCVADPIPGCTDAAACNYNPTATEDDGSCFSVGDACDDGDATTTGDVWVDCMTCAGTLSEMGCTDATACNYNPAATQDDGSCIFAMGCDVCDGAGGITDNPEVGEACDDGNDATVNDTVQADCSCLGVAPTCPASAKINEFHYDNAGGDVNEFVEIALPAGSDPSGVVVSLYNGNGGGVYMAYTLTATDFVSTDGTNDYYVWNVALQNGNDGIAVSCGATTFEFITYEGAFDATDGPAAGMTGVDVGVVEATDAAETSSIMCDGAGAYLTNCTQDPGAANDTSTCVADPIPGCTDAAACNYDPAATEDDGSCFNIGDACDDGDATTTGDVWVDCMTCAGTLPEMGCTDATACNYNPVATQDDGSCIFATGCDECDGAGGITDNPEVGEACDDGDDTTVNDTVQADCSCLGEAPTCPNDAKINEFHYDNAGTDVNEFVEIALPVGSDPSGVVVSLYNGNGGGVYGAYTLTAADLISSDAAFDYYVWNVALQNGNDGIAVSCGATVFEFITYEGAFDATDGPATGMTGVDVGVEEATDAAETSSIMCDGAGAYLTNCTQDPGAANDTSTCVGDEVLGCADPIATNYDPAATTDDGSCLYLCDDPNILDISNNAGFDGGTGLSYGLPGGMGLLAGANDDFGGFIWNVNTAGLTNDEFCIFIDYEVTGDAAAFPITLDFRIENNDCGFFPCPWIDFNTVITGPGTYTLGGTVSTGNVGANGPFDPAGANPAIVAAIANFSGTPLGGDVNVVFSNLCATTDCPVVDIPGCTDANACNYNPNATIDDSSCYNIGDACDADGDPATMDVWLDCATCGTMGSTPGCTDPNATNYDPTADTEDGTCLYLCDDAPADLLDVSNNGGFDGGSGLSFGSPAGMGLLAGANNDFAGFIWNVNTAGLTNDDFCISIDYTITGDAADFPLTLEFRIENGDCGGFPCPWLDFNTVVTGPGTYTLGGIVSSGNPSTAGTFDPAGPNTAIVAAIANFSGTPIGADINVDFSNLCVSTDCGIEPPADCAPNIIQFPANPTGN